MAGKYGHESYPSYCPRCRLDRPGYVLGRVSGDYSPTKILKRTGAVRSANVTPRYTGVMGGGFDDRLSWNGLAPLNSYISGMVKYCGTGLQFVLLDRGEHFGNP